MKNNTRRPNLIDQVMSEYVMWGGPVITRAEAVADCKLKGFDAKAIDVLVFGRRSVEAPEDPAAHVAFLRRIQMADGLILVANAA